MRVFLKSFLLALFVGGGFFQQASVFAQNWSADIGFDALVAEKSGTQKNGAGVVVAQPEGDQSGSDPYDVATSVYMAHSPGAGTGVFSGQTFANGSPGTDSVSSQSHAASVGRYFYGSSSVAPGISDVTGYDADDYINRVLGLVSVTSGDLNGSDPITPGPSQDAGLKHGFDVSNHSYIGNFEPIEDSTGNTVLTSGQVLENAAQRFDFVINRDNTVAVVGANNGATSSTPQVWAHSYNAITVGLTNGNHSTGLTTNYGAGRFKPDIVAPNVVRGPTGGYTSNSTPMVAGTAAVLRELANAGNINGANNEVIKSVIFAGATKEEFGTAWNQTDSIPIDEVFGVGELNILNSYHIMEGGEFHVSSPGSSVSIGEMGWDFSNLGGSDFHDYTFDILAGVTKFSAALAWNAEIIDSNNSPNVFDASVSLANLDLELRDSTGTSILQQSSSTDYNLEHIWKTDLGVGSYKLRVSGATGSTAADYGLAWRFTAVPEPSSAMLLGVTAFCFLLKRRRFR